MERNEKMREQNQIIFESLEGKRKQDFFTAYFESEVVFALRQLRKERNLTQKELAERSGLKQANISKIENLEKTPTITTIGKYLYALDFSLQDTYEFVLKAFVKSLDPNGLAYIDDSSPKERKHEEQNYYTPASLELKEARAY